MSNQLCTDVALLCSIFFVERTTELPEVFLDLALLFLGQ